MLTRAALLDPKTCVECHPRHYAEWQSSMHAYASHDPVFLAMNAYGQRVTGGALGDFCVKCHAPVAVQEGATLDGLDLATVPDALRGVTCYACHAVDAVLGTHNNPLRLAGDGVMRGGISDPLQEAPHLSAWSALHDRNQLASASLCGACHDVVNGHGVALERTFAEWKASVYGEPPEKGGLTCNACHLPGYDGVAATVPGAPIRRVHDHSMPGIDLALTDWPGIEDQRRQIQQQLDTLLLAQLCVFDDGPTTDLILLVENVAAGHAVPSGAAQDRRLWLELEAFSGEEVVFSTGMSGSPNMISSIDDPTTLVFGDTMLDAEGREVHSFWQAESIFSRLLPAPQRSPDGRYVTVAETWYQTLETAPLTRVSMRMRLEPIRREVLDHLVASGDLDPAIRDRMAPWTLGSTELEWRIEDGRPCTPDFALPPPWVYQDGPPE